jgi:flagellar FliL protein
LAAQPGKRYRPGKAAKASVNHTDLPSIAGERGVRATAAFRTGTPRAGPSVAIGVSMAAKAKQADAEVEDEPEEGDDQAPAKKGWLPALKMPSLKMMIIAAAGLLVVGGGGGGAYFYFFSGPAHEKSAHAAVKPALFVDLPDVLVNLSNPASERTQYLKVKIVLEVPDPEVVTQIQPLMPRVLDAFQTYLRELRPTDLDGSAGLYRLKEELTRRVNAAVSPNRITAVLFKEIVVQ